MSDDDQQPRPDGDPAGTEHTHPLGGDEPHGTEHTTALPVVPPAPTETRDARTGPRGGGRRMLASVAALSLLLGLGGGIAGAAAFRSFDDGGDGTTGDSPAYTSSNTSASNDDVTRSGVDDAPAPAEGSIEQVAADVLPSVVQINVVTGDGPAAEGGSGSGIILSSDGQILTNNHVVELAQDGGEITVAFGDGSAAPAEIVGTDALTDTALIQAQDVSGLQPATIGRSGDLRVGQDVVAVGSPFGLDSTVTTGIVSALDRPVSVGSDSSGNSTTYPAIQTDAAINPGNSGGPLVDLGGRVVGINSSIRTAGSGGVGGESGSIGLGFAIPLDEVMPIVEQMAGGETPTHARLGVSVGDVAFARLPRSKFAGDAESLPRVGALVSDVPGGGAAAGAGLEDDDTITKVDDTLISGADSLVATIRSYRPGDDIDLTWVRDGEEQTATITLGTDADVTAG